LEYQSTSVDLDGAENIPVVDWKEPDEWKLSQIFTTFSY
jgi:hypothetical protein